MIPQGETISASDTESFNLLWNGVMIECQRQSNLTYQNIGELMISSVSFVLYSLAKGFGPFLRGIWAGLKVLFY